MAKTNVRRKRVRARPKASRRRPARPPAKRRMPTAEPVRENESEDAAGAYGDGRGETDIIQS